MFVQSDQMVSSRPPKMSPNLVLWCIIMSRSVVQKRLLCYFKVKVTARAHFIKILQFLLYLLKCWSFCYQTCSIVLYRKPVSCEKNWMAVVKVKVTAKFQNVLLKLLLPNLVWLCFIMSLIVFQKDLFAVFEVKVTVKDQIIKMWLFDISSELMAHHHKLDCLVKRFDFSVVVKVKVTEKVQNASECSSGWYLLSCCTFCNQTWYGNASSWARVPCKKIGLLSSSSGSQWGLI